MTRRRAPPRPPPQAGQPPLLSATDLGRFCEFLYVRTGMQFGETKRYYIDRRLAGRMAAIGAATFADYFAQLRADATEIERLINSFTINETYFYREDRQLLSMSRDLLPEVVATRGAGDKIRIWSLPCSTGEEPYSIALWLLENWRLVDAYHVEIIGSDIDTEALAEARLGRYSIRALAHLPDGVVRDYFEPLPDGAARGADFELIQDLRESVSFTTANLVDAETLAIHGAFDIIFCRNLLIYFDDASRHVAVDNLYDRLTPGGFLCLGHSESLARLTDRFEVRRFEDAVIYQRPRDSRAGGRKDGGGPHG